MDDALIPGEQFESEEVTTMSVSVRMARMLPLGLVVLAMTVGFALVIGNSERVSAGGPAIIVPLHIQEHFVTDPATDSCGPEGDFTFDGVLIIRESENGSGGTNRTVNVRGDVVIDYGGGNVFTGFNRRIVVDHSLSSGVDIFHIAGQVHVRNDQHQTEMVPTTIHVVMHDGVPVVDINLTSGHIACVGKDAP